MALTFGPVTSQYDGRANNGDPTDGGPAQYSGAAPASCIDGATFANSGISSGAFGGVHVLSGTADAITGQNANQLASAISFNKVAQPVTRTKGRSQKVLEYFGWPGPTLDLRLSVFSSLNDGPANIRVVVWLRSTAGVPVVTIQHSYDLSRNAADPTKIDVLRDNVLWRVISNPDAFSDAFSVSASPLPNGTYTYQSELNVMSSADGSVHATAHSATQLTD